jgi:anti-sigma regulatory factor (Ser/Thr protein kinase)
MCVVPEPLRDTFNAAKDETGLTLRLANDKALLDPARVAVLDFLADSRLSERVVYQVELVLEELLMNIIWHAYRDSAEHLITVHVHAGPNSITMTFEDDGIPFDATTPRRPAKSTAIEAAPGGLGLPLVQRAVDAMAYRRVGAVNELSVTLSRS